MAKTTTSNIPGVRLATRLAGRSHRRSRCAADLIRGLLAVLALALLPAPGALAQEEQEAQGRSWQLALWMKGGYQISGARMANNAASDAPDLRLLETVSELSPGALYGGGLEVRLPTRDFTARIGWETLTDGEVTGQIAVCELFEGPLCEKRHVPAEVWTLSAVFRLVSGGPEQTIRPVISAGVGMRGFSFTLPQCPSATEGDRYRVCEAILDLYQNPKPHSILLAGIGAQAAVDRLVFELGVNGATGRYEGGSARTDGNWYHVLRFELSTSARVF